MSNQLLQRPGMNISASREHSAPAAEKRRSARSCRGKDSLPSGAARVVSRHARCWGVWRTASVLFFTAWATCASAGTATSLTTPTPCPSDLSCRPLEFLMVVPATVDPPMPTVGDWLEFAFEISSNGHQPPEFSCPCTFEADAAILEGHEAPEKIDAHTVVVRRRAVRAGVVTVVLHVRGRLEHDCYHSDPMWGCVHHTEHLSVDDSSYPFDLTIAGAATPTSTPTPTPIATARWAEDGGCQLGPHQSPSGSPSMPFLSVTLLLMRRLCRTRRCVPACRNEEVGSGTLERNGRFPGSTLTQGRTGPSTGQRPRSQSATSPLWAAACLGVGEAHSTDEAGSGCSPRFARSAPTSLFPHSIRTTSSSAYEQGDI